MDPRLILEGIATICLHFVSRNKAGVHPFLPHRKHVVSRTHLNAKVRNRASLQIGNLIQRQIQRWVLHVKLRVTFALLCGSNPRQLPLKLSAFFDIPYI